MRTFTNLMLMTSVLACPYLATRPEAAQADRPGTIAERVEFYEVPLMCPAARGLGCGSRAKPVLLALERDAAVEEAWLDRAGHTLAIVWKASTARAAREAAIAAVSEAEKVSIAEVDADARQKVAASFRSGNGWHRGADVDRLSEEEAGVIADRLWNRLVAKAPTASRKRDVVKPRLTDAIRLCLLVSSANCEDAFRATLLASVGPHLDDTEVSALTESIKAGFLPIAGEQ